MRAIIISLVTLIFSQSLFSQTPFGEVNTNAYEYSMSISGITEIDEIETNDTVDLVAAFVGDELRGVVKPFYSEDTDSFHFLLLIYSNTVNEKVTFKFYDASKDETIDLWNEEVFTIDDSKGVFSQPYIFSDQPVINGLRLADENEIFIYPHPAEDMITIDSELLIDEISILNSDGRLFIEEEFSTEVNLQNLKAGTYFLKLGTNQGEYVQQLIVK